MAKLMQTVYLDLPTVCDLLHGQSAVVTADIKLPENPKLKARGTVFLRAGEPQICECIIESGDGGRLLYSGKIAFDKLMNVAAWQVYFTTNVEQSLQDYMRRLLPTPPPPSQLSPSQPMPMPLSPSQLSPSQPMPLRRLMPVVPESVLGVLSLKDRLVLKTVMSMVDNKRSIADIQAALTLNPSVVADAVESLRIFGIIA